MTSNLDLASDNSAHDLPDGAPASAAHPGIKPGTLHGNIDPATAETNAASAAERFLTFLWSGTSPEWPVIANLISGAASFAVCLDYDEATSLLSSGMEQAFARRELEMEGVTEP